MAIDMVENFGSYLKHEREMRGVPLEEISGATKIHIRFLEALEENKFDELPGEVFVKGYIRSYANTIGSDFEEILNIYEESVGYKLTEPIFKPDPKPKISAEKFLGFGLTGLFLIALIFLINFIIVDRNIPATKKATSSKAILSSEAKKETLLKMEKNSMKEELSKNSFPDISVSEEASEVKSQKDTLIPKTEIQKQENSSTIKKEAGSKNLEKSLQLTIKVKNNSWFNLAIDDFRAEDFILTAGEEKSYWGNKAFRLTIGNKQGTEVILNGKSLALPKSKENVIKDFIINSKIIE